MTKSGSASLHGRELTQNGNVLTTFLNGRHDTQHGVENKAFIGDLDIQPAFNSDNTNTPECMHDATEDTIDDALNEKADIEKNGDPRSEFRSLVPFCVVFGLGSLLSQSLNVYLSSQITVIEKSFGLSSARSGILLSANDIGFVTAVLFASHFLKSHHIPRILAGCVFVFGVSGVLSSLPHFTTNEQMPNQKSTQANTSSTVYNNLLCLPDTGSNLSLSQTQCQTKIGTLKDTTKESSQWIMILIPILMVIQGIAKAPRAPLSNTYLDNNSERVKTGFYIGILAAFTIFGPFVAILAGGIFNKIPVDLKDTTLTPDDPRWIGAWWIGFIAFGACAIIISIPIFLFPASMRKTQQSSSKGPECIKAIDLDKKKETQLYLLKDMPTSLLRLIRQPVYTCMIFSVMFIVFAIMALGTFGPKYLEHQFHIPTWKANIILGLEKMVTVVLGTFFGGFITRRYRLGMIGCIKMIIITRFISFACSCFNFILGCDRPHIIGLDSISSIPANLSCDCSSAPYVPICADGQTYFSPCHAGCLSAINTAQGYANCTSTTSGTVHTGMCGTGCNDLVIFVALNAFSSLIGTQCIAPTYVVLLRSVNENDRSMGIGLMTFLVALLVHLPGPILYGKLLDSMCVLWTGNACSDKGSCSLYDISSMRFNLVSIDAGLKAGSFLLTVLALLFARRHIHKENKHNGELDTPPILQTRL